jgi:hypothetical protein
VAVGVGDTEGIDSERELAATPPLPDEAEVVLPPSSGSGRERWWTIGGVNAWKMRGVAGVAGVLGEGSPDKPLSGVDGPLPLSPPLPLRP